MWLRWDTCHLRPKFFFQIISLFLYIFFPKKSYKNILKIQNNYEIMPHLTICFGYALERIYIKINIVIPNYTSPLFVPNIVIPDLKLLVRDDYKVL